MENKSDNTYIGFDRVLESINAYTYSGVSLKTGELKYTKPNFITRMFELPADTRSVTYAQLPIIMESENKSFRIPTSIIDTDNTHEKKIGNIRLYKGTMYKDGENSTFFCQMVVDLYKSIKLLNGQLPKGRMVISKEYDSSTSKELIPVKDVLEKHHSHGPKKVTLDQMLPETLFISKESNNIVEFWKELLEKEKEPIDVLNSN